MFHYPSNANAFYGYPSGYPSSFSPYHQHPRNTPFVAPTRVNPRERYLAALAEAQAAEAEYLAAQAARQGEEAMLRRRLAELQLQRQREEGLSRTAGTTRHPIEMTSYQPFGYAAPVAAFEPEMVSPEVVVRRPRHQFCAPPHRGQAATEPVNFEQLVQALNPQSHSQPRRRRCPPTFEGLLTAPALHARPDLQPVRAVPTRATQPTLNDVFASILNGPQSAGASVAAAPQPRRRVFAPRREQPQDVPSADAFVKAFYDALLTEVKNAEATPAASSTSTVPAAPVAKKTEEVKSAPNVAPVGSSQNPLVIDSLDQLGQVLNAFMNGQMPQEPKVELSQTAAASSSRPQFPPIQGTSGPVKPAPQPSTSESALKDQLEARLENEYAAEVRDTIQAILNSLADQSSSPRPASSPTSSEGSAKGKGKALQDGPESSATSKDVLEALKLVNNIDKTFRSLEGDFTFPAELDFDADPSATSLLGFTSRNQPVRFYEQALGTLLSQLDAIESLGNDELRSRRKEVVNRVEKALEDLEREIAGRHRAHQAREQKQGADSSVSETPVVQRSETVEQDIVDAAAAAPVEAPVAIPAIAPVEDSASEVSKLHKSSPIIEEEEDESETASSVGSNDDLKPYEVVFDETAASLPSPTFSTAEVVEEPQGLEAPIEVPSDVVEETSTPVVGFEAPAVDEDNVPEVPPSSVSAPVIVPEVNSQLISPSESTESIATIRPSSPLPTSANESESDGFLIEEGARSTEDTDSKGRPAYKDHDTDTGSDWSELDA